MAAPIPIVRVGVTNILIKLEYGAVSPKYHPAPADIGGHTDGTGPYGVYMVVSAEKIGIPSFTFNPSPTGVPNITGSLPGASGAQLRGKDIQDHPPNPHDNPSAIS